MSQFVANSFQVPNAIIDDLLDKMSGNACKIYLLIVRKTRGWHKQADRISYSQIKKATGIASYATIDKALTELVDIGLITVKRGNEKTANEYSLSEVMGITENVKDKKCSTTKNVKAFTKNVKGGITKTVNTEIHSFKNTKIKNKSEYAHTHETQNFENSQNTKSHTEDKTTTRSKQSVFDAKKYPIGDHIDPDTWADFVDMRQSIKKPLTQGACKRFAKSFADWHAQGLDANLALDHSIKNSWQDVYIDRARPTTQRHTGVNHATHQHNPQPKPNSDAEYAQIRAQRHEQLRRMGYNI